MPDVNVEALCAECMRFAGATLGWRSRAALMGDGKLSEFAQRAGVIAMALNAVLDLHSDDEVGFCRECSDEFPAASPCPTVRAVAKELGVEADGCMPRTRADTNRQGTMTDGKPLTFGALLGPAEPTGVHVDKHGRPFVRRTVNGHMIAIYDPAALDPEHPWLLIHSACPADCTGVSGIETHPAGAAPGSRLTHALVGPWPFLNQWGCHEDWVLEQIDGLQRLIKAQRRDHGVTAAKLGIARAELARAQETIRGLRTQLRAGAEVRGDD